MKRTREWWRQKFRTALERGDTFEIGATLGVTHEEPVLICMDEIRVGDLVYVLDPVERRKIMKEYDRSCRRTKRP